MQFNQKETIIGIMNFQLLYNTKLLSKVADPFYLFTSSAGVPFPHILINN